MHQSKVLLTELQASEMIGLKPASLRKRRHMGVPPRFLKIGSKVFYDAHDIQDYLTSCIRVVTEHKKRKVKLA